MAVKENCSWKDTSEQKTLLEYIQLEHSYTVTETSFDSQCCQKIKKNKDGDRQIEKKITETAKYSFI